MSWLKRYDAWFEKTAIWPIPWMRKNDSPFFRGASLSVAGSWALVNAIYSSDPARWILGLISAVLFFIGWLLMDES